MICENSTGETLDDNECDLTTMPERTVKCKPRECQSNYKWVTGDWGSVSLFIFLIFNPQKID